MMTLNRPNSSEINIFPAHSRVRKAQKAVNTSRGSSRGVRWSGDAVGQVTAPRRSHIPLSRRDTRRRPKRPRICTFRRIANPQKTFSGSQSVSLIFGKKLQGRASAPLGSLVSFSLVGFVIIGYQYGVLFWVTPGRYLRGNDIFLFFFSL